MVVRIGRRARRFEQSAKGFDSFHRLVRSMEALPEAAEAAAVTDQ
jgi:hypothetical protein